MDRWETLFERASAHRATVEEIKRALAERREGTDTGTETETGTEHD